MLILSSGMPTGTEGRDLGQLHEAKNASARNGSARRAGAAGCAAPTRRPRPSPRRSRRSPAVGRGPCTSRSPSTCSSSPGPAEPRMAAKAAPPQADPRRRARGRPSCCAAGPSPLIIAGGGAVDAQAELTGAGRGARRAGRHHRQRQGRGRRGTPAVGRRIRSGCARCRRPPPRATRCSWSAPSSATPTCGRAQIRGPDRRSAATSTPPSWTRTARPTTCCSATPPPRSPRCATPLPAGPAADARAGRELRAACREEAAGRRRPVRRDHRRGARRRCPPTACSPATVRRSPTSAPCTSSTMPAPRRFCYSPGFATLGYGLPGRRRRGARPRPGTGRGAARRRRADVLRAGAR